MEEDKMKRAFDRLSELFRKRGIVTRVNEKSGISTTALYNIRDKVNKGINPETIYRILDSCPEITEQWLFNGVGEDPSMVILNLKKEKPDSSVAESQEYPGEAFYTEHMVQNLMDSLEKRVQVLVEQKYEAILSEKERSIQILQAILFQDKGISPFQSVTRNTTGRLMPCFYEEDALVIDVTSWRNRTEIGFLIQSKETA